MPGDGTRQTARRKWLIQTGSKTQASALPHHHGLWSGGRGIIVGQVVSPPVHGGCAGADVGAEDGRAPSPGGFTTGPAGQLLVDAVVVVVVGGMGCGVDLVGVASTPTPGAYHGLIRRRVSCSSSHAEDSSGSTCNTDPPNPNNELQVDFDDRHDSGFVRACGQYKELRVV